MKVLMVLTSHDQLGNTGTRPASGSRNWRRLTMSSRMPAPEVTLASPKGGRPHSIPRATSRTSRPISRAGSRRMPTPKPSSTRRCGSIA